MYTTGCTKMKRTLVSKQVGPSHLPKEPMRCLCGFESFRDEGSLLWSLQKTCQQTKNACSPSNQRSEKQLKPDPLQDISKTSLYQKWYRHFPFLGGRGCHIAAKGTFTIFVLAFASFSLALSTFITFGTAFSLLNFWLIHGWWQHGTYKELLTSQANKTMKESRGKGRGKKWPLLQSGLFCPYHGIHKSEASVDSEKHGVFSVAVRESASIGTTRGWLGCYTLEL